MRKIKVVRCGTLLMAQLKMQLALVKFRPKYNRIPSKKMLQASNGLSYPLKMGHDRQREE